MPPPDGTLLPCPSLLPALRSGPQEPLRFLPSVLHTTASEGSNAMSESHLIAHCGARVVDREQLKAVSTPAATRTWFPIGHLKVLQTVEEKFAEGGFRIERERLALSRGDARFFGTLDLQSAVASGVTLAVGIRNSTDKS